MDLHTIAKIIVNKRPTEGAVRSPLLQGTVVSHSGQVATVTLQGDTTQIPNVWALDHVTLVNGKGCYMEHLNGTALLIIGMRS